jgi:hypothetical protein
VTTNNARTAFLRSYHLPTILEHYSRLVGAMQRITQIDRMEAAVCIRELKAGRRWSGMAVDRYGGTHKLVIDAWSCRHV